MIIPVSGSSNYVSDEQKEIARLNCELRDAQDALDVLKKSNQHSGKMTEVTLKGLRKRKLPKKRWTLVFRLWNVEIFRYLTIRISCLASPCAIHLSQYFFNELYGLTQFA